MIRDWVPRQLPAVPPGFIPHLDADEPVSVDGFLAASRRALSAALEGGDTRDDAFALLAADAYVTWACALTLDEGGGAAELEVMAGRLIEGLA